MPRVHLTAPLLASLTLAACGGGSTASGPQPSGATCPPGSTLRYAGGGNGGSEPADFGSTFFASYCLGCHGATPLNGAPAHATFNVLAVIQEHAALIDQKAAKGPARTNTEMPPLGALSVPTEQERTLLGQWIACGAPGGP